MDDDTLGSKTISYIFSGLFFIFSAVALLNIALIFKKNPGFSISKTVIVLIPIATTARAIVFVVNPEGFFGATIHQQNTFAIILGGLVGYIFISCYILLALFWLTLLYKAQEDNSSFLSSMIKVYVGVNASIYSIWILFMILIFTASNSEEMNRYHNGEAIYASLVSMLASLTFCILGARVLYHLNQQLLTSPWRKKITRQIGILTTACTILFALRGMEILIFIYVVSTPESEMILDICFFLICELLPSCLITIVLSPQQQQLREEASTEEERPFAKA
eukprot:TRINITY_DN8879_c0_g1_i1.p1 TRINITY_DN8879_c0_g1~~TRINITY_DN8879_c0_g1_i1.p1  ORF type:complete len:278 (+),score=44.33 TRINITY_DN8879_c0_g1_i1:12-845(+)